MLQEKNRLNRIRHSLAHLMAAAVLKKYPDAEIGIGPTIDDGFYYDFNFRPASKEKTEEGQINEKALLEIEKEIQQFIKMNLVFRKEKVSPSQARAIFKKQPYKLELIKELEKNKKPITIYKTTTETKSGSSKKDSELIFVDLCEGEHVKSTKEIKIDSFKIDRIAGAYWRGNEKNSMLTRIYGLAFNTKRELDDYLKLRKEAKERDHRKIGEQLDIFCFSNLVGPGLPLFKPSGVMILEELKSHMENICKNYGYEKVSTPSLAKIELFNKSGHAEKFAEELFHVSSERKHDFVLKPVQCPHHTQIYASKPRSYRDLPIRYMESEKQYRAEKSGEVGGLNRVYAITIEDGHVFCRPDQVKEEIKKTINIIKDFYSSLNIWKKLYINLSVRDYDSPEKYIGEPKDWDKCEKILERASSEMSLNAKRCEGEAALYGPKLDFMFKNALGKEIQIPTIQLDFATPKRFNLAYTDEKGKKVSPIMIHRAVLGSYERFLVLLIEHYAGAFPLWLAPIQVSVLAVSQKQDNYARTIYEKLKKADIRTELTESSETLGKRIREAELQKVPYALVVGEKEKKEKDVNVRSRNSKSEKLMKIELFIQKIQKEIKTRKL